MGSSSGAAPPGVRVPCIQHNGSAEAEVAAVALNVNALANAPRRDPALPAVRAAGVGQDRLVPDTVLDLASLIHVDANVSGGC